MLTMRYMSAQYHVDIADLGNYTLLPPLLQAAVGGVSGVLADRLLLDGWSVRGTRRTLQVRTCHPSLHIM